MVFNQIKCFFKQRIREDMIILKTPEQIEIIDEANRIVHKVLDEVESRISIGATTRELDEAAERLVREFDAEPAFKGYAGYPSSLCVSINDEIVHGIPGDRIIQNGDIVGIDFGAIYKGYVGDAARTIVVGDVSENIIDLVHHTQLALIEGLNRMSPSHMLFDISEAIAAVAKEHNYGNIKNFCGHGIGAKMHEDPKVFNYINTQETNVHLQEGMVLALEPMFTLGGDDAEVLEDGWTAVTSDGTPAAHWEYSVVVTKDGPRVLGVH